MTLEPGTELGPYEIVELRGKGGMGEVYRARDSRLRREIALKVLPRVSRKLAVTTKGRKGATKPPVGSWFDAPKKGDRSIFSRAI